MSKGQKGYIFRSLRNIVIAIAIPGVIVLACLWDTLAVIIVGLMVSICIVEFLFLFGVIIEAIWRAWYSRYLLAKLDPPFSLPKIKYCIAITNKIREHGDDESDMRFYLEAHHHPGVNATPEEVQAVSEAAEIMFSKTKYRRRMWNMNVKEW